MMTLAQIQAALKDRRPGMVAKETGLHLNTVLSVRNSSHCNPTNKVMQALSDYFDRADARVREAKK